MKINFNTNEYQFTHGKSPKGSGLWIFTGPQGFIFETTGTFRESKAATAKAVRRYFSEQHHVEITVAP